MDERAIFDRVEFGMRLKSAYKAAGYRSADAFSKAIADKTGMFVTKDTIYKIVQGVQDATIQQVIAFSITLYGRVLDHKMIGTLLGCMCDEWQGVEVPSKRELVMESAYTAARLFDDLGLIDRETGSHYVMLDPERFYKFHTYKYENSPLLMSEEEFYGEWAAFVESLASDPRIHMVERTLTDEEADDFEEATKPIFDDPWSDD